MVLGHFCLVYLFFLSLSLCLSISLSLSLSLSPRDGPILIETLSPRQRVKEKEKIG